MNFHSIYRKEIMVFLFKMELRSKVLQFFFYLKNNLDSFLQNFFQLLLKVVNYEESVMQFHVLKENQVIFQTCNKIS